MRRIYTLSAAVAIVVGVMVSCSKNSTDNGGGSIPAGGEYVAFAWNDLGMHCLNPTYDTAVILPPYNNLWVQIVKKGDPPTVITSGLTVEYSLINNTYSYGKRSYGQFWDNVKVLFGVDLEKNKGLNLHDPGIHNGLSGVMTVVSDHFQADGIPATPVNDQDVWDAYQVAKITVKNAAGDVVAKTETTVPVSDEINCAKCHYASDPFLDVLMKHDMFHNTKLAGSRPVLCASCHSSPALGAVSPQKYLSLAIHKAHAPRGASCYDCHPGQTTSCNRSKAHTAADGNCTTCHGSMSTVAQTVETGGRIPWVVEPKCAECHGSVSGVDTGATLYRQATGHGGLYCISCHGSPHAMVPSLQSTDNYQAIKYQGKDVTIGSCGVCHSGSKGESGEIGEFSEEHGGKNPSKRTACNLCHNSTPTDRNNWPHAYTWKNR